MFKVNSSIESNLSISPGVEAFEELAIHFEHRERNPQSAMEFTLAALERLATEEPQGRTAGPALPLPRAARFTHRLERLQRKAAPLKRHQTSDRLATISAGFQPCQHILQVFSSAHHDNQGDDYGKPMLTQ